ncbi:hypothetical protein SAOR_01395 [Salinisphaera orenii MK-B5]|uniref:DUF2795 domain-containing protein n=2 Tax=Salinisphaera orenii TaxID=856731 RepID=A0A423PY36_9GAMM|nr:MULTISPECIES: DUF2795 domain-containing protein [Salinisphaera]ROO23087.1 hypothetical protein SAHL_16855 [Salinisphaera halophila YIM 95161]ROO30497.1 hypothetical protein SAOR_01395 [Salinisphaera orenii MK-B5]
MARPDHASASEIQTYLTGIDYPASKQQLADHAERQGAPLGVRTVLDALPDDEYSGPAAVSRAVGAVE